MYWSLLGILLLVCLACCAVGFKRFVWFLSIGYGFAIAGGAVALLILCREGLSWITLLQGLLFVAYGARLSGFLLYREVRNAAYRKTLQEAAGEKPMPIFVKLSIWLCVGVLYVAQLTPVLFRHMNGASDVLWPAVGMGISLMGLVLETLADLQKSAQKKTCPNMVATRGLYRMVRCPNYFGEILFWTGVLISGVTALSGFGQWLTAILAWICIVYIMFNGAQRLERRQQSRYGAMPEYQRYVASTPVLLPLIPIYHVVKEPRQSESNQ